METFKDLPIKSISESPTNPRKNFDEASLKELALDVGRRGILQPVLVRESPLFQGNYELIFGHRRFRAAQAAGLTMVPAMIRQLGDAEVLELQLVENVKRSDLHPLEAADGYRRLHETHGLPVAEVAKRVGKSTAAIYDALSVGRLGAEARKDWLAGDLSAGAARRLALIPAGKTQDDCLGEMRKSWEGRAMDSAEEAWRIINKFMRELAKAPFDTQALVAGVPAVACMNCEKRSGAQPQLFSDVKQKDVCLDVACYETKVAAWWKQRTEASKVGGGPRCLSREEARKICSAHSDGIQAGEGYVEAGASCGSDMKNRTYKALLGKEAKGLETLVLHPVSGQVLTVYPAGQVAAAMKRAGKIQPVGFRSSSGEKLSKAQVEKNRKARAEEKLHGQVQELALGLCAGAAEKRRPDSAMLELLARLAACCATWRIVQRRESKGGVEFETSTEEMTDGERLGLIVEVMVESANNGIGRARAEEADYPAPLKWAVDELDIDLGAIEAELRDAGSGVGAGTKAQEDPEEGFRTGAEIRRDEALLKEKRKKWQAKKRKDKKGTCSQCGCTESTPCVGGCAWIDDAEMLCTACVVPDDEG